MEVRPCLDIFDPTTRWRLDFNLADQLIAFVRKYIPIQTLPTAPSVLPAQYLVCPAPMDCGTVKSAAIELSCLPQQASSGLLLPNFPLPFPPSSHVDHRYAFTEKHHHLISPKNLMPVVVLLSQHLPTQRGEHVPSSVTQMTSFYFDNQNFDVYRHCLGYSSGSLPLDAGQAISLHQNKLEPNSVSVQTSSQWTSEVFQVRTNELPLFLKGKPVSVTPQKMMEACAQVQSRLQKKIDLPRIKVTYTEFTFQSDRVWISVKFNYQFFDLWPAQSPPPPTIRLDWDHDPIRYNARDLVTFPWGVMEIRLKESFSPSHPFLVDLLKLSFQPQGSRELFSIYSHAVYSFQPIHMQSHSASDANFLPCPPWWSEFATIDDLTMAPSRHSPKHWFAKLIHNFLPSDPDRESLTQTKEHKLSLQKIYFSCERTFLAWVGAATYPVTLGLLVSLRPGAGVSGGIVVLGGVGIVVYAITTYAMRLLALENPKAEGMQFYDLYGPVLLSLFISASWAISWLVIIGAIQL
jgi:hypothetical protein